MTGQFGNKNKAWSARFSEPVSDLVKRYTASVDFDQRLAEVDIRGSLAHAAMLAATGILSESDLASIQRGFTTIREEIAAGRFEWSLDLEDVHLNIEKRLTELVGDADRPLYLGAAATGRPLMQYFGLLLSYLRGGVTILDGTDHWAHALAGLEANAVVLAATFDRHPAPVEALLRLAGQRGATSILLTNRRTGPLVPLADILLTTSLATQEAMFRTRVATLIVLEAILDAVAAEHPEQGFIVQVARNTHNPGVRGFTRPER